MNNDQTKLGIARNDRIQLNEEDLLEGEQRFSMSIIARGYVDKKQ